MVHTRDMIRRRPNLGVARRKDGEVSAEMCDGGCEDYAYVPRDCDLVE